MTGGIPDLILGALAGATPLVFAALGGLLSERAGVINLALEGFMLVGAFGAVLATYMTGSPFVGLIGAVAAAAVFALVYAFLCLDLRADQIVAGIVMNLLAAGICAFLVKRIWNAQNSHSVEKLFSISIAFGDFRREISILVPVALVAVIVVWFILRRTVFGLNLRAAGEDPSALVATGVSPRRVRYIALLCTGVLCGFGGAFLSIGYLNYFTTTITHGMGFIAIAALIMGNWRVGRVAGACLLIGAAYKASYMHIGFGIPNEMWRMLPYVLTIVVLCMFNIAVRPPRALGRFED